MMPKRLLDEHGLNQVKRARSNKSKDKNLVSLFKESQFDCFSLASTSLVSNTLLSKAKSIQKDIFELVIDYQFKNIFLN